MSRGEHCFGASGGLLLTHPIFLGITESYVLSLGESRGNGRLYLIA
jgi:hypothetical protein